MKSPYTDPRFTKAQNFTGTLDEMVDAFVDHALKQYAEIISESEKSDDEQSEDKVKSPCAENRTAKTVEKRAYASKARRVICKDASLQEAARALFNDLRGSNE